MTLTIRQRIEARMARWIVDLIIRDTRRGGRLGSFLNEHGHCEGPPYVSHLYR